MRKKNRQALKKKGEEANRRRERTSAYSDRRRRGQRTKEMEEKKKRFQNRKERKSERREECLRQPLEDGREKIKDRSKRRRRVWVGGGGGGGGGGCLLGGVVWGGRREFFPIKWGKSKGKQKAREDPRRGGFALLSVGGKEVYVSTSWKKRCTWRAENEKRTYTGA